MHFLPLLSLVQPCSQFCVWPWHGLHLCKKQRPLGSESDARLKKRKPGKIMQPRAPVCRSKWRVMFYCFSAVTIGKNYCYVNYDRILIARWNADWFNIDKCKCPLVLFLSFSLHFLFFFDQKIRLWLQSSESNKVTQSRLFAITTAARVMQWKKAFVFAREREKATRGFSLFLSLSFSFPRTYLQPIFLSRIFRAVTQPTSFSPPRG